MLNALHFFFCGITVIVSEIGGGPLTIAIDAIHADHGQQVHLESAVVNYSGPQSIRCEFTDRQKVLLHFGEIQVYGRSFK